MAATLEPGRGALAVVLCLAGFGCTAAPNRRLERAQDINADLQVRLNQSAAQLAESRQATAHAQNESARLQEQLQTSRELHTVLEQRVENFRRENERLHTELTRMAMTGGGKRRSSAVALASAAGDQLDFRVPQTLAKGLESLAAGTPGATFVLSEKLLRLEAQPAFVNGDQLTPAARAVLKNLGQLLNDPAAANLNLLVVGHTASPTAVFNELAAHHPTDWHLAAHQAIAVQQYLEESGVSPARVGIVSYGSQQPLAPHNGDNRRGANARLEIYLMPPDPPAETTRHTAAKPVLPGPAPKPAPNTSGSAGAPPRPRLKTGTSR
jgi:flagellar motor protein MotB